MIRRYLISLIAVLALPTCGLGQTGVPPFASFSKGQFDAINNANLNVIFAIPIMSSPGRGLNLNASAVYNSQVWAPQNNGAGALAWTPVQPFNFGWLLASLTGQTSYQAFSTGNSCGRVGDGGYTTTTIYNGYMYVDPLGTPHHFNSISVKEFYSSCTNTTSYSGTYSAYASDSSGYYASISDPSISLYPTIPDTSGVVIASSGNMTDSNGNFISAGGSGWIDSAGR